MTTDDLKRSGIILDLKSVLECPVKWENFFSNHLLIDRLYETWLWVVRNYPHQVRDEGDLVNQLVFDSLDTDELNCDLINLKTWIHIVQYSYLEMVVAVHRIDPIKCEIRPKHWPPGGWTKAQVIERSINKEKGSYFFHSFDRKKIYSILQAIIGFHFDDFIIQKDQNYYIDLGYDVGASKQAPTSILCFYIEYSTPSCHVFPVAADEVDNPACFTKVISTNKDTYINPPKAGDILIGNDRPEEE